MSFESAKSVSETSTTPRDPSTALVSVSSAAPSSIIISITLTDPLRDYILPTRSARSKACLINGESFKNTYIPDAIELEDRSKPASGNGSIEVKLEDRPLPVPSPTLHQGSGREPSSSTSPSPVDARAPPGLEGSALSETFAAEIERARNVLGYTRGSSLISLSSPSGRSAVNTSVYAAAARALVPAYSYQPATPPPPRGQVGMNRADFTIIEEPRSPLHTRKSLLLSLHLFLSRSPKYTRPSA
ncbi:hypothetical protein FS749_012928 [Ceratobasidium sp. UAMH 11750]|nr:hypothetical protein FS749_012928 [Ceratobasidium sp. UAMH 11750]